MTSITQLLSPWPVSKHSIVLREQHYPPPPPLSDHMEVMQQHQPSSPQDPGNDGVTGSAESDNGENGDGRKGYGKRELSTSKRAAQNRAAQVSRTSVSSHVPLLISSAAESIPTTEGRLHQEARGASPGLSGSQREFQSRASRKLSTPRLHYQPAITIIRVARRGPAPTQQCRRFAARQTHPATRYLTPVVRTRCHRPVTGRCQQPASGPSPYRVVPRSNIL